MDNYNNQQNNQYPPQQPQQYPSQNFVPQKNVMNNQYGQTTPQINPNYVQQPYMPPQPNYQPYNKVKTIPPLSPEDQECKRAATVSLILGIFSLISIVFCGTMLLPAMALIPAIVSLIFAGKAGKSSIKFRIATVGKVLSIIAIVLAVILTALIIWGLQAGVFDEIFRELEDAMQSELYGLIIR